MQGQGGRVLVIGASEGDARLYAALRAAGLRVEPVPEADLLASGSADRPAVLILAGEHPRLDRQALQQKLRAHPSFRDVPMIVLSEDCGIDSFGGAIAEGASAFFRRPLVEAELTEAARRLARWPEAGTASHSRRGFRRPLLLGVDVDAPGHAPLNGRIVDASATGCRLELPQALATGTTVGIVPRSCFDSTEIRLGGTVRWSRRLGPASAVAVRWSGTAGIVAGRLLGLAPR
jgi:CheY-like chemotaxis protein